MKGLANLDPKKREQYLMILCGVILVLAGIPLAFYLFGSGISTIQARIEASRESVSSLELKRTQGLVLEKRIRENAARALPDDKELAALEYKNWLTTISSRFEGAQVTNTGSSDQKARVQRGQTGDQGPSNYYTNHKFTLRGKTTLRDLGTFLQRFYEVQTLHLIRNMTIKPIENARRVEVVIQIESLSIPQTRNKSYEPTKKEGDESPWSRMIAAMVDRNFFAPYVRPQGGEGPPPPPQPPTLVAASKHTYLNGVTWSNNRPQAWFDFRLEGRQSVLRIGDRFRIGEANCTIEGVNDDNTVDIRVEFRNAETREVSRTVFRLAVGDTFYDAEFVRDLDEEAEASDSTKTETQSENDA